MHVVIHEVRQPRQRKRRGAWTVLTMQTDSLREEIQDGGLNLTHLKIVVFGYLIALTRTKFFLRICSLQPKTLFVADIESIDSTKSCNIRSENWSPV